MLTGGGGLYGLFATTSVRPRKVQTFRPTKKKKIRFEKKEKYSKIIFSLPFCKSEKKLKKTFFSKIFCSFIETSFEGNFLFAH